MLVKLIMILLLCDKSGQWFGFVSVFVAESAEQERGGRLAEERCVWSADGRRPCR